MLERIAQAICFVVSGSLDPHLLREEVTAHGLHDHGISDLSDCSFPVYITRKEITAPLAWIAVISISVKPGRANRS